MNKTYLVHHGIKGQRWGVRRFQNDDGTLTPAGEKRYGTVENMERVRSRNKKIMIGVGVASAVAGTAYLINRNRKLKKEVEQFKTRDALKIKKMQDRKKAAQAKRAADIAAGIIPPKKLKIPVGSDVIISTPKLQETGKPKIIEALNIVGGTVLTRGKSGGK
jgi:hypothetical protein